MSLPPDFEPLSPAELKGLIVKCKPKFASPAQTVLTWTGDKAAKKEKAPKPVKAPKAVKE